MLAAVERAGAMDDTAFFLVADHGMEETNPEVRGDWGDALRAAGIGFRDEAFGFIYHHLGAPAHRSWRTQPG